ncbi:MAG: hypothetical protein J3K34DRAFT_435949 [Monoraphidium minutum]|nr:MAG: hypothetical protein J3K34DRAFT_435949 [Monoraphidium minutum]
MESRKGGTPARAGQGPRRGSRARPHGPRARLQWQGRARAWQPRCSRTNEGARVLEKGAGAGWPGGCGARGAVGGGRPAWRRKAGNAMGQSAGRRLIRRRPGCWAVPQISTNVPRQARRCAGFGVRARVWAPRGRFEGSFACVRESRRVLGRRARRSSTAACSVTY